MINGGVKSWADLRNRAKKQKKEWPFDDRFEVKLDSEAS
jgi:hypothetical protein